MSFAPSKPIENIQSHYKKFNTKVINKSETPCCQNQIKFKHKIPNKLDQTQINNKWRDKKLTL